MLVLADPARPEEFASLDPVLGKSADPEEPRLLLRVAENVTTRGPDLDEQEILVDTASYLQDYVMDQWKRPWPETGHDAPRVLEPSSGRTGPRSGAIDVPECRTVPWGPSGSTVTAEGVHGPAAAAPIRRHVIDELAIEFPQIRGMISIDASDPLPTALLMFGAENLVLHAPVPAQVGRLTDVTDVADLISGAPGRRHVYPAARPAARWRQQFTLEPRAVDDEDPQRPVVALQVPHRRDGRVGVRLWLVDEPDQLTTLARAHTELGLLSSVSLACTGDVAWRDRWLPALAAAGRSTLLLDRGIIPTLRAMVASGEHLRYTLIAVGDDPDLLRRPVVLAVRLANDPLLLAPCGLSAGQAVTATWLRLPSGRRLAADLATTNREDDILPSIVHHLTHDESVVGFWQ